MVNVFVKDNRIVENFYEGNKGSSMYRYLCLLHLSF